MCGIIGFVAPKAQYKDRNQRLSVLTQGLFVDTLRGNGGTGIACAGKNREISVFKRGLAGPDFLTTQMFDLARRPLDDSVVAIGHNRAATIGNVSDSNSHPFHYKDKQDIALVHNGTVNNYTPLTPTSFNHSVDSAHIAYAMAIEEDEMTVLKRLKGAFVLVWYNATKSTFNIARNDSRDIWYNVSTDGTLYFCSEYLMLDWLMSRCGVSVGKREYRSPTVDSWYQWAIDDEGEVKKPVVRKISYEKEAPLPKVYPGLWTEADIPPHRRGGYYGGSYKTDEDILGKFGMKRKDLLFIDVDFWEPYNRNTGGDFGRMEGEVVADDSNQGPNGEITVSINGVRRDQWEKIQSEHMRFYLPVRVISYVKYTDSTAGKQITVSAEIDWEEYRGLLGGSGSGFLKKDEEKPKEEKKHRKTLALPSRGLDLLAPPKSQEPEEPITKMLPGPNGSWVTEDQWKALTDKGCVWCADPIAPELFERIKWVTPNGAFGDSAPLCQKCSANTSVMSEVDGILRTPKVSQK